MGKLKLLFSGFVASILAFVLVGTPALAASSPVVFNDFTQTELNTWITDRTFPSGGATSVTAYDRENVAQLGVDASNRSTSTNSFYYTEGIQKRADFGSALRADLYIDSAWQSIGVRAGLWGIGIDTSPVDISSYPIVEFTTRGADGHIGWRYWNISGGWTNVGKSFSYGKWAEVAISLNASNDTFTYSVDGEVLATIPSGGTNRIDGAILNSYNYAENNYLVHWHNGVSYEAAPAVAAKLLKNSGISAKYGLGRTGGNYIADVAKKMGAGTDFNGIKKSAKNQYECEIVKFLRNSAPPALVNSTEGCYEYVETVTVPATQTANVLSTNFLTNGSIYSLKAYGTANAGDGIEFDADYSYRTGSSATWTDAVSTYEYLTDNLLNLTVGGLFVNWDNDTLYNSDHTYSYQFTGDGNKVSFGINDTYAVNNSGELKVDIYKKLY